MCNNKFYEHEEILNASSFVLDRDFMQQNWTGIDEGLIDRVLICQTLVKASVMKI